jgi:hypothetical protein
MRILTVILLMLACLSPSYADGYPALAVPPAYAGPAGESGQILLDGIVKKVSVFHGRSADEADWHVYIDIPVEASRDLSSYLRPQGVIVSADKLDVIYSEIMSLDKYDRGWFDDKFYSADFTPAFLLATGSAHPAWDLGKFAVNNQGTNHDFSTYSKLWQFRVYLQGALVNDSAHGTLVEIHPLDSIAFAMNSSGVPISQKRGQSGWPLVYVRWRVAVFANSNFHRITGESYVKKERTTTWFLDLPANAVAGGPTTPGNITVTEQRVQLWDGGHNNWYSGRRWKTLVPSSIAVDPKDGRKKLKVTTTMLEPDKFGGIVVRDYIIQVNRVVNNSLRRR